MPKNYPEYPIFSPENYPFSRKVEVRLIGITTSPLHRAVFTNDEWEDLNAISTYAGEAALTCYSPDLLTPVDYLKRSEKHQARVDRVAEDTRVSGHSSTREHLNFVFAISNLSRHAIYELHSHPHYVTDQESQRFVTMSKEGLVLPMTGNTEIDRIIEQSALDLFAGYEKLSAILKPIVKKLLIERFPGRRGDKWQKALDDEATKRAQEIARYLLPLSMGANLWHSVNALTLARFARLTREGTDPELSGLICAMVAAVAAIDPTFLDEIGSPIDPTTLPESRYFSQNTPDPYSAADQFDAGLAGLHIRLDGDLGNLDHRLAEAVRLTLGASRRDLTDQQAVALVLDSARNPLLAEVGGEITLHQLSRALNQVSLSARVSLSHVIDSQLQRHRGLSHTRPLILPIPRLDKDIVIPELINMSDEARELYLTHQAENIRTLERLAAAGIDQRILEYCHTNGTRIRKRINGPLGAFHHLLRQRTCLTAQAENYDLAVALIRQLPQIAPTIAAHFGKPAPCGIRARADTKPYCSEGKRYCGIPIWEKKIADYPQRDI